MINVILQFLGLDLFNIKLSANCYQNIPNGLRVKFNFFQNLNLGKTSNNPKCHLTNSWATSCQYQCVCKISSQYSTQFKRQGHFHFFRIWISAKSRPMKNDISQSLWVDLVNFNHYAKVYQNILSVQVIRPFSLFQNLVLDKCHFTTVSLFQNLNLGKNSTNLKCHLTISWGISCQYQCACKISSQYSTQFKR